MLYEAHGIKKFVVVCGYTDLRKGIPGLSQIIEGSYRMDPFERDVLFLFCGRRGDRIKALLVGRQWLPAPIQTAGERISGMAADSE